MGERDYDIMPEVSFSATSGVRLDWWLTCFEDGEVAKVTQYDDHDVALAYATVWLITEG